MLEEIELTESYKAGFSHGREDHRDGIHKVSSAKKHAEKKYPNSVDSYVSGYKKAKEQAVARKTKTVKEGFEIHRSIVQNAVNQQQVDLSKNVDTLLSAKIAEKIDGMRSVVNNTFFGQVQEEAELDEGASTNSAASLGFKHGHSGAKKANPHPPSSDAADAYDQGYHFGKNKKEKKAVGLEEEILEGVEEITEDYATGYIHGNTGKKAQNPHAKDSKGWKDYELGFGHGLQRAKKKANVVAKSMKEGPSYGGMRTSASMKLMGALAKAKARREETAKKVEAHKEAQKNAETK